ncbi:MAG: aminoacyl-tRNA hydrolase [Planctomycetes bacterium]|nr:aminoacyl-tRNA hydrolase [Planctomycetota bacterium]
MKAVIGLGNPGQKYFGTRHNVGFDVVDVLASRTCASVSKSKWSALYGEATVGGEKTILLKPMTFMNLSGNSVRGLFDFFKLDLSNLIVIVDDVHLPLGRLRIRAHGSPGGHNGLRSIERALSTSGYPRLRLGVGGPGVRELSDHVLSKFSKDETAEKEKMIEQAADAIEKWITEPFLRVQEFVNRDPAPEE